MDGGNDSLGGINRMLRQHGLTTVIAKPLKHYISHDDSILLQQSSVQALQTSLQQLVADNEHSRNVNQQLMLEIQGCRSSLFAEKQKNKVLSTKVEEQASLLATRKTANEEVNTSRLAELRRHGEEMKEVKDGRDMAWAQVSLLSKENEQLKQSVADLQASLSYFKDRRASTSSGSREQRLSEGDSAKGFTHTLGLISTSRGQVHRLQHDINGLRQQMRDYKDSQSRESSPELYRKQHTAAAAAPRVGSRRPPLSPTPVPPSSSAAATTTAVPAVPSSYVAVGTASPGESPPQSSETGWRQAEAKADNAQPATPPSLNYPRSSSCGGPPFTLPDRLEPLGRRQSLTPAASVSGGTVVGQVLNTDIDSRQGDADSHRGDVLNSTFETDHSAWVALGEKVEQLDACNRKLQEELRHCKRGLQQAALERSCLRSVCRKLSVPDYTQLPSAMEKLMVAVDALPSLEKFLHEVNSIVPAMVERRGNHGEHGASQATQPCSASDRRPHDEAACCHADWCAVRWSGIVSTLRLWRKIVDEAPEKEKIGKRHARALQSSVNHIQKLFNVEKMSSLLPAMNAVYLRVSAAETFKKTLCDALCLEEKCGSARIVSVVESVVEAETSRSALKLIQERDHLRSSLTETIQLLTSFRTLMAQIVAIVGVDSPSKVAQEVATLKLQAHAVSQPAL